MDFDSLLLFSKQFSLVWFFLIFIGVVAWAYWPSHKKGFEDAGNRQLDDDPLHDRTVQQSPNESSSEKQES
jgi:cytochrome c oxidase cbb3-type subunit IV